MTIHFRLFALFVLFFHFIDIAPSAYAQTKQNPQKEKTPTLVCDQKNLLFFFQGKDLPLPQNLVCHNQGNAPLFIQSLALANPSENSFLFQSPAQKKILPGQTFSIQLSFRPNLAQLKPAYQNELILASNDPKQSLFHISIKAEDNPNPLVPLHKNPDGLLDKVTSLDFGQVQARETSNQTIFLRGNGNHPRFKYSISIEGTDTDVFSISSSQEKTNTAGNEDSILVFFKPNSEKETYSAFLKISYQFEQSGKPITGELLIQPIQGSVKYSLFSELRLPRPVKKYEKPKPPSRSRFSLGMDLGLGGMLIPAKITQYPNNTFTEEISFQLMFLGKVKTAISVLPHPSRAISEDWETEIDFRLAPYFQFGYISPNGNAPLGVGMELQFYIFPGYEKLFSIGTTAGIGYTHLSWPQPMMEAGKPPSYLVAFSGPPSLPQDHLQISLACELSFGLDSKSTVKGFDFYVAPQFVSFLSFSSKSAAYGLGMNIPIGIRYNFY